MYINKPLHDKPKKKWFKWWGIPLALLVAVVLIVLSYVVYVLIDYKRIDDKQEIAPVGSAEQAVVKTGTEYTAMTYNVGFGAYTPDFSFFMDGGKSSWAESKESVIACIDGAAGIIKENDVDFALIQEVDFDSTRSYHVDERRQLIDQFPGRSSTFAVNYDSPFLFYPFNKPHGASGSGLLTFSGTNITSALRRSLPISDDFKKFLDLDRCYIINRIPVENGRELVIINLHTSAYGTNSDLQTKQLTMLFDDMKAEYEKGNYVIAGGDFNHDFTGDSKFVLNKKTPGDLDNMLWCAEFPADLIPEGFRRVTDFESGVTVPSSRDTDIPYGKDSFVVILDGFIVSDNIDSGYVDVLDTGFIYSDHNPVKMKFSLK